MFKSNAEIKEYLNSISSEDLKKFNKKIIPSKGCFLGCKIPDLRRIAAQAAREDLQGLMSILSNETFEEIMLRGIAIGYAEISMQERLPFIDEFLLLADNWAHIDCAVSSYKFIGKSKMEFLPVIDRYLVSDKPFLVRFALVCLLGYYVEEEYLPYIFKAVENIDCGEYYVSMAAAWLISICYVKHALLTEKFLINAKVDSVTFNRAIGKICDSHRVSKTDKDKLKKIKRKI